jgi:hypothetical protein
MQPPKFKIGEHVNSSHKILFGNGNIEYVGVIEKSKNNRCYGYKIKFDNGITDGLKNYAIEEKYLTLNL